MEKIGYADPVQIGPLKAKNRVMMAALTRMRCDPKTGVPSALVVEYYRQRAGAGAILTEATAVSQRGEGFPGAACLYNEEHVDGWKQVIEAVHARKGLIFVQLFHAGRATHPTVTRGLEPFAPSALHRREEFKHIKAEFPVPKEMTQKDIDETKREWRLSLELSRRAGFDGVQIHGAHGYLIDTFLKSSSNRRGGEYGGSVENRCRFALELVDLAIEVYGDAGLVGMKISPVARVGDVMDDKPLETFSYLLSELSRRGVGFVEVRSEN